MPQQPDKLKTIVIAEPDPHIARFYQMVLSFNPGLRLKMVGSHEELVVALRKNPHLLISEAQDDHSTPIVAFDAMRRGELPSIPTIVATNKPDLVGEQDLKKLYPNIRHFFTKPFESLEKFEAAINETLNQK